MTKKTNAKKRLHINLPDDTLNYVDYFRKQNRFDLSRCEFIEQACNAYIAQLNGDYRGNDYMIIALNKNSEELIALRQAQETNSNILKNGFATLFALTQTDEESSG